MTVQPTTETIWTHLSTDLRKYIRGKVSDDYVADDLLQETFMRVHRSIGTLQESDRVAAWVYQIARNVVHDHHRKGSNSTMSLADVENVSADNDPQIGCLWLNEMTRSLPDGYREAVQLAEIEELPQQAVADRLGLSLSGAKSRIQRGRGMLKQALEECCSFEWDVRGRVIACDPKPNQKSCQNCET